MMKKRAMPIIRETPTTKTQTQVIEKPQTIIQPSQDITVQPTSKTQPPTRKTKTYQKTMISLKPNATQYLNNKVHEGKTKGYKPDNSKIIRYALHKLEQEPLFNWEDYKNWANNE